MAKKNQAKANDAKKDDAPTQEPTKEPEQAPATVEGAEQENPEGVVSTEQAPEPSKAAKGGKGAKYIAQWDLEHNRKKYGAGDEVKDLSDEHAKSLLAIGVIKREG